MGATGPAARLSPMVVGSDLAAGSTGKTCARATETKVTASNAKTRNLRKNANDNPYPPFTQWGFRLPKSFDVPNAVVVGKLCDKTSLMPASKFPQKQVSVVTGVADVVKNGRAAHFAGVIHENVAET